MSEATKMFATRKLLEGFAQVSVWLPGDAIELLRAMAKEDGSQTKSLELAIRMLGKSRGLGDDLKVKGGRKKVQLSAEMLAIMNGK